jgi:hypothetical protein
MTQSLLDCLRDETALRLEAGTKPAQVQNDLIESATGPSEGERIPLDRRGAVVG